MKRTGRFWLSFLNTDKQSMEKMSQFAYWEAFLFMRQRIGLMRKVGRLVQRAATLSITDDRQRKGESRMSPFTSQEYISANMMEHMAPMLLPQRVTLLAFVILRISCSTSLISKTSLTPQVRVSSSLLPQPRRSKAAIAMPYLGIYWIRGRASSLLPPLPCKQTMVSEDCILGRWKMQPEMRLLLRLRTSRSVRMIVSPSMTRSVAPKRCRFVFTCGGCTMFFQADSYRSIFVRCSKQFTFYFYIINISIQFIYISSQISPADSIPPHFYKNMRKNCQVLTWEQNFPSSKQHRDQV